MSTLRSAPLPLPFASPSSRMMSACSGERASHVAAHKRPGCMLIDMNGSSISAMHAVYIYGVQRQALEREGAHEIDMHSKAAAFILSMAGQGRFRTRNAPPLRPPISTSPRPCVMCPIVLHTRRLEIFDKLVPTSKNKPSSVGEQLSSKFIGVLVRDRSPAGTFAGTRGLQVPPNSLLQLDGVLCSVSPVPLLPAQFVRVKTQRREPEEKG